MPTDTDKHLTFNGYTQEDWDEVSDNPELTEDEIANARPFAEAFPELMASIAREGVIVEGSPEWRRANSKAQVTLRLDRDVVDKFRATGRGWQTRINAALRKAAETL